MGDFDVAVVGSGAAGLAASLLASDAGVRVILMEGSDVIGGSTRLSAGVVMAAGTRYQQAAGINDSADELFAFYMSTNHWTVEPAVVRALADESAPTVEWLGALGVNFHQQIYLSGDEPTPRGHAAIGKGAALVEVLYAELAKRDNVLIATRRRIDRLLARDGRVVGVGVGDDEVTAGATVLAMGGFGANLELVDKLLPEISAHAGEFFWYLGADTSQGDVFKVVEPLDVQILGQNRAQMALRPDFVHIPDVSLPGWLVLVNGEGRRFFNELSPPSITQPVVLSQPQPIYAVFDDEVKRAAQPHPSAASRKRAMWGAAVVSGEGREAGLHGSSRADWEDWVEPSIDEMHAKGKVVKAETVAELANAIGVPVGNLQGTLDRYNADVAVGHDSLYFKEPSAMRPVATGPFYAVEVRLCQAGLTGAGVRIGPDGGVLDAGTRPVAGLYAAGECTGGVLGDVYMGFGNSLCSCLTLGRIAGRSAAAAAKG